MVTFEEALRWASNVDDFKLKASGIATTGDIARDEMAARAGMVPGSHAPTIERFGR